MSKRRGRNPERLALTLVKWLEAPFKAQLFREIKCFSAGTLFGLCEKPVGGQSHLANSRQHPLVLFHLWGVPVGLWSWGP